MKSSEMVEVVSENNLYARFGITDCLSEDELMDVIGGDCTGQVCFCTPIFGCSPICNCVFNMSSGCGS